jgi:hypothetical protein
MIPFNRRWPRPENDIISWHAFFVMLDVLDKLESEKAAPLPWGLYQKYFQYVPSKTPDEMYEEESPWTLGLAACIQALITELDRRGHIPFVDKKKK